MESAWLEHLHEVARPALLVAPRTFLTDIRATCVANGVSAAVANHNSAPIFNALMKLIGYQGISDSVAAGYSARHGDISWADIELSPHGGHGCPLLTSFWNFSECGYSKSRGNCSHPLHLPDCHLPRHPLRKGLLNQAAYSLRLFIRDVCNDDIVDWIDRQLAAADGVKDRNHRAMRLGAALLDPLRGVFGVSDKLWAMMLADLLLGADPGRDRWLAAGASLVAIDNLVHNFLHRTGVLHRARAEHLYGSQCYTVGGCADIIAELAENMDAREFNKDFPRCFPRFVQNAIWRFSAQSGSDICNGNRIYDQQRCENSHCPNFDVCDRIPLRA